MQLLTSLNYLARARPYFSLGEKKTYQFNKIICNSGFLIYNNSDHLKQWAKNVTQNCATFPHHPLEEVDVFIHCLDRQQASKSYLNGLFFF